MSNVSSTYKATFELSSSDDKPASTSRKVHLRRLNDILHLSLERGDLPRAHRAWAILARCKEFDWKTKWQTSLILLPDATSSFQNQNGSSRNIEVLRKLMRYYPDEQESILQEIILHLSDGGKFGEALEELDLYLPSFPYQESPVLHSYAGLLSLKLATSASSEDKTQTSLDVNRLLLAKDNFNKALSIDPDNLVAGAFIGEVDKQLEQSKVTVPQFSEDAPSDEEMDLDGNDPSMRGKRLRRTSGDQ